MPVNEVTYQEILSNWIEEDTIFIPGYDDCIIGMTLDDRLIYDWRKIIRKLEEEDGMNYGEAIEFFGFNINIYPSNTGPIFQTFFVLEKPEPVTYSGKAISKTVGILYAQD